MIIVTRGMVSDAWVPLVCRDSSKAGAVCVTAERAEWVVLLVEG